MKNEQLLMDLTDEQCEKVVGGVGAGAKPGAGAKGWFGDGSHGLFGTGHFPGGPVQNAAGVWVPPTHGNPA